MNGIRKRHYQIGQAIDELITKHGFISTSTEEAWLPQPDTGSATCAVSIDAHITISADYGERVTRIDAQAYTNIPQTVRSAQDLADTAALCAQCAGLLRDINDASLGYTEFFDHSFSGTPVSSEGDALYHLLSTKYDITHMFLSVDGMGYDATLRDGREMRIYLDPVGNGERIVARLLHII